MQSTVPNFRNASCTRRSLGRAAALGIAATATGPILHVGAQQATPGAVEDSLAGEIVELFESLPGRKALKFWSPGEGETGEWSASLNPSEYLFCASAFKAYVLAEFLIQIEAGIEPNSAASISDQLGAALGELLPLDDSVFSPGAPVFNPPNLTGMVTVRTTLEAMISHSDNTATDMALKHVGPDTVRQFIAAAGLQGTRIPDSTRQFFGYVGGDPEWKSITWEGFIELATAEPALYPFRPIINDEITMVSSPDDFVSFYSRALQGAFFQYAETLSVFRAILSIADAIALSMPLGVNAFLKGGSIDFDTDHALSMAGGMWVGQRWVYFAFLINWTNDEAGIVAEVETPFLSVANRIFTIVRDRLGGGTPSV